MQNTSKDFKQLAIIGSTASGKTSLAIRLAKKIDAYILSLDSLAIYKEINIVSAKPMQEERNGVIHFGLDVIAPNEHFDVTTFIGLYHDVYKKCIADKKNLIIVGGTGFYLKMLLEGISDLPSISESTQTKTNQYLKNIDNAYALLYAKDEKYMSQIKSHDTYRITKALNIYFETNLTPSQYFTLNPAIPTITKPIKIYQILWPRELLRERITLRTKQMLDVGLIDEICLLEKKYTRTPNCMKSIGIKETLAYLDGMYNRKTLEEKIITNTARLAKRQNTFNNSQFNNVIKGSIEELEYILLF